LTLSSGAVLNKVGGGSFRVDAGVVVAGGATLAVLSGTLALGTCGSLLNGTVSVASDATLQFAAGTHYLTPSLSMSGSGNVSLAGSSSTVVNLMVTVTMTQPSVWLVLQGELVLFPGVYLPVALLIAGGQVSESGAGLVQLSSLEVTSGTYTISEPTNVSGACVLSGSGVLVVAAPLSLSAGCVQVGGALMVQPGAGGSVVSSGGVFVLGGGSWIVNGSGTAQIAISGGLVINGSASIAAAWR
jgi:hypothetical protein